VPYRQAIDAAETGAATVVYAGRAHTALAARRV